MKYVVALLLCVFATVLPSERVSRKPHLPADKKVKCTVCQKLFSKKSNMRRHYAKCQSGQLKSKPSRHKKPLPRLHKCGVCGKRFSRKFNKKRHIGLVHKDVDGGNTVAMVDDALFENATDDFERGFLCALRIASIIMSDSSNSSSTVAEEPALIESSSSSSSSSDSASSST